MNVSLKTLIISDYFEPHVGNILRNYVKGSYNKSGLVYEDNIFKGFINLLGEGNVKMMCAPTYGTFPNTSRLLCSPAFKSKSTSLEYVRFCNLLYYRNISRYNHLKKSVKRYLKAISNDDELIVLVIQMHEPFMKIVNYIKKRHTNTKSCLNIWDFPDMMNDSNLKGVKKFLKAGNNTRTYKLLNDFDMFFYLCEGMREKVEPVAPNKPYIVHEGIISEDQIEQYSMDCSFSSNKKYRIVYTGKLTKKDGVLDLISAVKQMNRDDIVLDIAGGGEICEEMMWLINGDERIKYHGVLNRNETLMLQKKADCFVVPRLAENYTGYSFPSKVIEYILTGKPIIAHKLKCFDAKLDGILTYIQEDGNENLKRTIMDVVNGSIEPNVQKRRIFVEYNMNIKIANEIINFLCIKKR